MGHSTASILVWVLLQVHLHDLLVVCLLLVVLHPLLPVCLQQLPLVVLPCLMVQASWLVIANVSQIANLVHGVRILL
jgi:hypothetical protein